jgi:hypothetical protein
MRAGAFAAFAAFCCILLQLLHLLHIICNAMRFADGINYVT